MSWSALLLLATLSYAFKYVGLEILGGRRPSGHAADVVRLLPPALLAGLVAIGTFSTAQSLALDARAFGLGFAALATWRKWSFAVVVVGAAAVTALTRLVAS